MITLEICILLGIILFSIGLIGILTQKNFIKFLMCVEIMVNGVNVILASVSAFTNNPDGNVFVLFILALSAVEIAVGLSLAILVYRTYGNIDLSKLIENLKDKI